MFNLRTPAAGEPWDVTALAQLSEHIRQINQKLMERRSAKSSLQAPVRLKVDTEDTTIWTGKVLIADNVVPNPSANHVNWSANFDITFKSVPVVTASTFCATSGGTIAANAIWLHEVTPVGVKGRFKWLGTTTRPETVYAMIIAVGEGSVG